MPADLDELSDLLGQALTEPDDDPAPADDESNEPEWTYDNIAEHPDAVECVGNCGDTLLPDDHEHADLINDVHRAGSEPCCEHCLDEAIAEVSQWCDAHGEEHIVDHMLGDLPSRLYRAVREAMEARFLTATYSMHDTHNGTTFCEEWAEQQSCYECGDEVTITEVIRYTDDDGDTYCRNCRDEDGVSPYNYAPEFVFRSVNRDGTVDSLSDLSTTPGTPYLGIEIEMEDAHHRVREIKRLFADYPDHVWFMRDGSLDDSGVEMATHPATFEYLMGHFPWENLQRIADLGARSYHRPNCGIHVHISADAFSHSHLFKFLAFHYRNATVCQTIGQRGSAQWSSWSEWLATRPDIVKYAKKEDRPGTRYMAVNLTESQTIELRYFRGNLSPTRVRKNLQWVQALYEYTKQVPAVDTEVGLTFGAMLPWLKAAEQRERFGDLLRFIEKRDMHHRDSVGQYDRDDL